MVQEDTTTTAPGCPADRPEFGSPCSAGQAGLSCDYGEQECCGEMYPEITMQCDGETWQGFYIDTLCGLGRH